MINFLIYAIMAVFVVCSILLVLVVLMQRPRSEGLGTAFGGGVTDTVFGAQTSDVLTKMTVWLGGIFFICTLSLAILYSRQASSDLKEQLLAEPETVATTPAENASGDEANKESANNSTATDENQSTDEEVSSDNEKATTEVTSDAPVTEASQEATKETESSDTPKATE